MATKKAETKKAKPATTISDNSQRRLFVQLKGIIRQIGSIEPEDKKVVEEWLSGVKVESPKAQDKPGSEAGD
jgi:hypothetical protein